MNFDELEILFDEDEMSIDGPSYDQLYQMYGIFLADFHKTTLLHIGKRVMFNNNPSKHPLFRGKFQGFVHLVTRVINTTIEGNMIEIEPTEYIG